jgi:hypothetical protein
MTKPGKTHKDAGVNTGVPEDFFIRLWQILKAAIHSHLVHAIASLMGFTNRFACVAFLVEILNVTNGIFKNIT